MNMMRLIYLIAIVSFTYQFERSIITGDLAKVHEI